MSFRRLALSAVLLTAVSGGCAASRVGSLSRPQPLAERPQIGVPTALEFVDRHNQNAAKVTSLEATPTVSGKIGMRAAGTRGLMVFERPHNFRFVVESGFGGKREADIGSNEDEFWFWGNDKNDQNVYVCRYDAASKPEGGTELSFQPDWIVEALGLREIPETEARAIKVTDANRPNAVAWTHSRQTLSGEPMKKVTIVDRTTGQIIEHQFFAPRSNKWIATATPSGVTNVALGAEGAKSVSLPRAIHLSLAPADPRARPIELDLALNSPKVNKPIDEAAAKELFSIPNIAGSEIKHLDDPADPANAPRTAGNRARAETRNSVPAPEAGTGAELGEPAPFGPDEAYLKKSDPMPLEADLGRAEKVIGMPLPTAPEDPVEKLSKRENRGSFPQ